MGAKVKVELIADTLREQILLGQFSDMRLPPFKELVKRFHTTQETMNKVIQLLQAEGILISKRAKGVHISTHKIRLPGLVSDFYENILKNETDPIGSYVQIPKIVIPSEEIAKKMKLPKQAKTLHRIRKQGANGMVFRISEEYFPLALIDENKLFHIEKNPHFNVLKHIQDTLKASAKYLHEELIVRLPTSTEQELLQVVRINPVIDVTCIYYAGNKKDVICYSHRVLNANVFLLTYDYSTDELYLD